MGTGLKFLFEKEVIMNQGTNLGSHIGRWIILAALVAVLGALLLTMRPVGAQDAPPSLVTAKTVHYYPENHTTLDVHRYSVREPDNDKVFWTLSGTDAASFTIEGGTLRFKSQPNYEVPTDRARAADTTATPPVTEVTGSNNAYQVTVRSSGGGEGGEPGSETDDPPDDHDGNDLDELEVTVHVTNVDEDGKVNLSSLQPQVGTTLTATVSDPDGVTIVGSWQWASSDSMTRPSKDDSSWKDIPEQSNRQTYQPVDADLGKYLRVTARYRDNASKVDSDIREVMAVSSHTVRKDVISSNQDPKFPDQKTLLGGNAIVRASTERFILENSPGGTKVGAPVTAFDDETELEVLTYSLEGAHKASFNIHQVTGQITVSAAAKLNADVADDTLGGADTPYRVTVVATDGDGKIETIDVRILVVGYNEPPSIGPNLAATPPIVAAREMTHWEVDRTDRSATTIDTDLDSSVLVYTGTPPTPDGTVDFSEYQDAIYTATDQDAADRTGGILTGNPTVMWSLAGDDAEKFFIYTNTVDPATGTTDPDARTIAHPTDPTNNPAVSIDTFDDFDDIVGHLENTGASARLAFKAGPDHEMPGDKNKDNVYEVTIVATDSVGNTGEYPVTVKVKNSTDDNKPGKVTVLNRQPEVKARLEAKLVDGDGSLTGVTWQWYRLTTDGQTGRSRCADYDPRAPSTTGLSASVADNVRSFVDQDLFEDTVDVPWENWEKITGAKGTGVNAHYTPGYDARVGGRELGPGDNGVDDASDNTVQWVGGDIDLVITTTAADTTAQSPPTREFKTYAWTNPKCLRVAFMYEDAVDPTNSQPDDLDTAAVDETLEGAYKGSEFPVKRPDDENDAPVFTQSSYTATRSENAPVYTDDDTASDSRRIIEATPATDVMAGEDDDSDLVE